MRITDKAATGGRYLQAGFRTLSTSGSRQTFSRRDSNGRVYVEGTNPNVDRAVDDALAATGFKLVNLGSEFTGKWIQAQKDAATVAAVGAWLYDQKFKNESEAWKSELRRAFEHVDFIALPTLKNLPPHVPFFGGTAAFEAQALALQNTQAVNFGVFPLLPSQSLSSTNLSRSRVCTWSVRNSPKRVC
jgi:Asp-tRNA(Asn)/Glu-tRNA(Gln) amidotransferase A subunit family amidase